MSWVAASIAVFIIGYTFISLEFRKANRPYEPYYDLKERGQTHTLLEAGYQRITLTVSVPTGSGVSASAVAPTPAPAGVPPYLAKLLFDPPLLPATYANLQAASGTQGRLPYTIDFTCHPGAGHSAPNAASAYVRADTIVIVPECESEGDQSAGPADTVRLTIPPGELKPGRYQIVLVGGESSLTWTLQVN